MPKDEPAASMDALRAENAALRAENAALSAEVREAGERLARAHAEASARLLATVFESAPDAMVLADDAGRYVDANAAACALFGLPREELVGRAVSEFAGPAYDVDSEWSSFRRENCLTGTFPLRRADGQMRELEFAAVADVLPGRHLSILRDATERHDKARRTETLLSWVVASSQDAIVSKDLTGVITSWTRAAEELYGYSASEAIGANIRMLIPPERMHEEDEILRRIAEGTAIDRLETTRVRKDGLSVEVEVSTSPVKESSGRVIGASTIALDLAGRRRSQAALQRMEEQLRQAQKMEAVGQLAGGIAHDFNNLLSVVLSYTDLVLDSLPDDSPLRQDMEEVARAGTRAAELTRQLLAFGRRQVMQPTTVDPNRVVHGLERMLRRVLGEAIDLAIVTPLPVGYVFVDPGQVEQVILNLVVNARDAMPSGGKITIETRDVELDVAYASTHLGVLPGPYVVISVRDAGVGMTSETLARIFEPFFTTKEVGKGTGLGLAMVFGIVKQSGGHIAASSELGHGTTMEVYLPRAHAAQRSAAPAPDASMRGGTETVLVVEDDHQVRAAACTVLRRSGYTVLEASNGSEALVTAERFPGRIDLLLTDVVMPGMSGPLLAKELLALRPDLRVLYVSGYTPSSVAYDGVLGDGIAYLQKPVNIKVLLGKVRSVLDGAAGRGEAS